MNMTAERLMMVGGILAFGIIMYWVRKRELREKYALGWIAMSVVLLIVGVFPELLKSFAGWAHLAFPTAVLFLGGSILGIFCFTVSVSLSRAYRRQARLTQEIALLEKRIRELESACAEK